MMRCLPNFIRSAVACGCIVVLTGCGHNAARVAVPAWNPNKAASQALAQFDRDGDGAISGSELDVSPGLKVAASFIDSDKDGRLSPDEIAARLTTFGESRVGLISVACCVQQNGSPISGATVTLVPEEFLGSGIEQGAGVTDAQGMVVPSIPDERLPNPKARGIRLGIYRVEVSHKVDGKEQLPFKYNTASQLGLYVSPDSPDTFTINLMR